MSPNRLPDPPPVIVITGASRGIGAATARLAAVRGYAVCVNYRADRAAADRVVASIRETAAPPWLSPLMWRMKMRWCDCSRRSRRWIASSAR